MLWNMGGTGAGIGCNSGQSCSVSGSGNITATLRWVYNDSDTSTAPNPPAKIAILESANAGWTGWIDNPISGAADPSQIQSLSVSGSADDGENDVFQETISGGTIIGQDTGVHYSVVDSSSGTVTKSASMSSSGTASISSSTSDVGYISPSYTYTVSLTTIHAHPTNFHLSSYNANKRDFGLGETQFWYDWDSTSGVKGADGVTNPDLGFCTINEIVDYYGNNGTYVPGTFYPSDYPFVGWSFINPTSTSRPAVEGRLWDQQLRPNGSPFNVPLFYYMGTGWTITAHQQMRFHCSVCGADEMVPGTETQNVITRHFAPLGDYFLCQEKTRVWEFSTIKHSLKAWLTMDYSGYIKDSLGTAYR